MPNRFKTIFSALLTVFIFINNSFANVDESQSAINQIKSKEAMVMMQKNDAILIDVRNGSEYDEKSIPDAILINSDKLIKNYDSYKKVIGNKAIILHCKKGARGAKAAKNLQQITQNKVYNLEGGIDAWEQDGMPIITSGVSVIRQVQITVGIITIIFALLGFYKNRKFLMVNIFIGFGLLFAGVTGSCALARLIKMMPWN